MRRMSVRLVVIGLLLASCSGSAEETTTSTSTTTSTTTTTTTTSTTTTTTTVPHEISPLTGLPATDPELINRRVLAVKIDNHPSARPQSGFGDADMYFEYLAEGATRFMGIFLESDTEYLGPMRSARPTDSNILAALNSPTLARSGAQAWVSAHNTALGIHLIGEIGPPATFRIPTRRAPHNLYVNTFELRNAADQREYPDEAPQQLWEFGPLPDGAPPASSVTIRFTSTVAIGWIWDEESGLWLRSQSGLSTTIDQEGVETTIGAPVLIALYVEQYVERPPAGVRGTPVPASLVIGSGEAFVFADGKVIEAEWQRETVEDWFSIIWAEGEPMAIPPGKAWISLVPRDRGLTYAP